MSKLVYLNEDGQGNIFDENGVEAMDIVDEKGDPYAIKQLVNLQTYLERNPDLPVVESNKEEVNDITMKTAYVRPKKYELYSDTPREMFFHFKLLQLMSVRAAALKAGVKESTARYWCNKYVQDPDNFVIGKQTNRVNRPKAQLNDEHKDHLVKFFDDNTQATIQDAVEELVKDCNLSIKKATFWPESRSDEANLIKRLQWSGFDINMRSSRAWAPKGKEAVVLRPLTKAPSHSIIGAISSIGVINLSIRVPKAPPKIRKIQGGKKRKVPEGISRKDEPKGTTTGHYLKFINDTLDIMDKYENLRGFYFIMDNAPIHTSA
ncbi:hypothetical protein MFLAVUS_004999 [Mucor flavus]|uniref:Tc1-like transposase DDE domain-containing protein n=1 Tax=Mucor flavus TaxID=439312 RepID=A0ABP9YXI0_9FUNG